MGGIFTLQAIVVALIIIMCLMAFAVNYTKAFRVKNEIRNIIEKNEGLTPDAEVEINNMVRENQYYLPAQYINVCHRLGYKVYEGNSNRGGTGVRFCIKCEYADSTGETNENESYRGAYYSVVTFISLDIPIINNIIPFAAELFMVSGETPLLYSENNNNQWCD